MQVVMSSRDCWLSPPCSKHERPAQPRLLRCCSVELAYNLPFVSYILAWNIKAIKCTKRAPGHSAETPQFSKFSFVCQCCVAESSRHSASWLTCSALQKVCKTFRQHACCSFYFSVQLLPCRYVGTSAWNPAPAIKCHRAVWTGTC